MFFVAPVNDSFLTHDLNITRILFIGVMFVLTAEKHYHIYAQLTDKQNADFFHL